MKEKELVTFNFDGLTIVLADEDYVWLPGNYGYYSDDKFCLIKMKRDMFIDALNDWISQRAEYNKRSGYGAGYTEIVNYEELDSRLISNHFWEKEIKEIDDIKDITVSVIEAIEYDSQMEHG